MTALLEYLTVYLLYVVILRGAKPPFPLESAPALLAPGYIALAV